MYHLISRQALIMVVIMVAVHLMEEIIMVVIQEIPQLIKAMEEI